RLGIDLNKYGNKIFGIYKTFHNTSSAKGIGLFLTKNQVEALGGTISVESNVNEGSTFRIKI
ncbi:MAG: ATP-binding protein, partial [Cyclobacteriaceae bacterium]